MNEKQLIEELNSPVPVTPTVIVPPLEKIEGIARRRTELRNHLVTVGCLLLCAAFVGFMSRRSSNSLAEDSTIGIDLASQQETVFAPPVKSLSEGDASKTAGADLAEVPEGREVEGEQEVRVYATVIEAVPVFRFEENSQVYRHLGWVDQRRVVPVDLSELSADQQQSFEAVLQESNQPTYYNL